MRFAVGRALVIVAALAAGTAHAQFGLPWRHVPRIVVVGAEGDPRLLLVDEAISFWNHTLGELGSGFKLGSVERLVQPVPEEALQVCGRPALSFRSDEPSLFPLTDDDKRQLLRMYPADWKPNPP